MGGWTYMPQCSDQSYYVGSTSYDDVATRVAEHNDAKYVGYTAYRRPVILVWSMWFDDLRDAHARERQIKGWSRAKKKALISGELAKLKSLSSRRAGKPVRTEPRKTKRELITDFHSFGARRPEVRAQRATKDD